MSQNTLPPINLGDDGINTHILAQQQYSGHCASGTYNDIPREIQKAEAILAILCQQNLTIGQFILESKNEEKLTWNSQSALVAFLQGQTMKGTQPINIVHLMFHHHLSQDRLNEGNMAYHPLPIYSRPPTLPLLHSQSISSSSVAMSDVVGFDTREVWDGVRAHNSLKQYFLCEVLEEINNEMKTLVEEKELQAEGSVALTWKKVMAFSFTHTHRAFRREPQHSGQS